MQNSVTMSQMCDFEAGEKMKVANHNWCHNVQPGNLTDKLKARTASSVASACSHGGVLANAIKATGGLMQLAGSVSGHQVARIRVPVVDSADKQTRQISKGVGNMFHAGSVFPRVPLTWRCALVPNLGEIFVFP